MKRTLDCLIGLVLLLLFLPIIMIAGLLVKLTSRGPVFYWQTRMGKNGKPFFIYKLRTMRHQCEKDTGPKWATPGDCRITWIGRILRSTHIDEFPQLVNVLRGEMSLVGPRPERPEFLPKLEQEIPDYRLRLAVKPGLTGLAQIHLPPDTGIESVQRKLRFDLYYIRTANTWLDLRLIVCTGMKLFFLPLSVFRFLLRIPGQTNIESRSQQEVARNTGRIELQTT